MVPKITLDGSFRKTVIVRAMCGVRLMDWERYIFLEYIGFEV